MNLSAAMRAAGFEPPNNIPAGQTVRFSTNGKSSDKAGWVHLFTDSKGAVFGCNRTGEQHTWQEAHDKPFSAAEQAKFKQDCIAANKARNLERDAGYRQAAIQSQAEWDAAALADELHPYLMRKGINPNMARTDTHGNLLIPVYGLDNTLQSLQRITPDGGKRFAKGGKMRGGHVWLGKPENGATLLLSEGFATGDTLHRATNNAACVCFSAGNLRTVAEAMRKQYPKADFIIAGDDDTQTEGNPGRAKAEEAAEAVAGAAVFPEGGGDFNDLEQSSGLDAVRSHFELMRLPVVQVFDAPALSGTDARDGTNSTRPLSELGNAMRLMDAHGGNIQYVHDAKAWLQWRGDAWAWDVDGAAVRSLAARLPKQIYSEGGLHVADAIHFAKWSRTSQKERTVLATVSLLQDFEQVRLSLSLVDADLFKVGFDNGRQVLDLRTGRARPALQSDLITKALNVDCLGESTKAVRWQAFLTQIFGDDTELIDWLQRWCGYMLTGSTAEQIFVFCFGLGANGKSVLGDILRYILSDYARAIASETLTESKRAAGSATPDLAELVGARMAVCAETEDGAALAESLVKSLVSGDTMTARKLHCDPFQFTPQFKLMMLGNHKPIIKGNDHGIWRRVRLIPFKRTFKPEERDAGLADKLKAEAPHILAWMVEGCLDWQQIGLKDTPKTIEQATGSYQVEQDLIGNWLSECCDLAPMNEASTTEIYANYKNWCIDNGLRPNSNIALGRRLGERGFNSRRSNGTSLWSGLAVINSSYSGGYGTASGR
ncbi:MAG: phage/plasmid primase, P4 family [Methylobacter sp.]|nr:phage/plasmid primase, P4 family [Methylobacter sp.]MDP2100453.1 phage/plasmid primase, P4 family [Methylobacter sp.]MDP2428313.1 phage/plasmid primase, P4 family [Methylobacter sp.]MDP3055664.1 phage/plasmid primase, P4 family [Methylobacter sp.]MDP3361400.1 phage/plasmid primase, P4 family [Methylobacter sp.]